VDWQQCVAGGDDYALGRELLLGEVNAAIDGALAAGADEILVNDSHSVMRNLPPDALGGRAAYLSGRFKPRYMMEGLDGSFAACSLHPHEARERIRTGVHSSLSTLDKLGPPRIALPATLEVDLASPDMAEQATWLRGVERLGPRTVTVTDGDPLRLFGTFVTLVYLTRSLVDQ